MSTLTKTTKKVSEKNVVHNWHVVDAKNQIVGRIAPQIAQYLQGKHKPTYVPYLDAGDYVVVINASKVKLTGKKEDTKEYTYYSGYPGGLRKETFKGLQTSNPTEIMRHAVSGMLPKNTLREKRLARLYIYPDENHPYKDKLKVK